MDFSTMVLTMYLADVENDGPENDERVLGIAVEQALFAARLGYNPWLTEHHFRGPWHSNPMQFAAFIAPQIPADRYFGFGVLSIPYYHPVRLAESMNLLDQLMRGRTLFGMGSGFAGTEPLGLGIDAEYHRSGRAAQDTLEVLQRLWAFETGDPEYTFELPTNRGTIRRRITPSPYRKAHPTIIRTASRNAAVVNAAQNGWPAFLGTRGGESPLEDQLNLYCQTLADTDHPQAVVDECLRWSTVDWLSVVVAPTDAEAEERAKIAKAERFDLLKRFVDRFGEIRGNTVYRQDQLSAAEFDTRETIAGSPDTVMERVQGIADLGINHLLVRFLGEWAGETRYISEESMELFSREVMPRFLGRPLAR